MEMRRPFSWKVLAVNPEATTRKEQQQTSMLKEFVVNSIILPIKTQLEQKYKSQEKELTKEEQEQIAQQIEQELQTLTPPEVKKYMLRDHQDPAEVLANQILEYVIEKENVRMKFNKAWKHALISGKEIYWTGIINGQPTLKVINPLNFDFDKSSDADFIEDGEWAAYETYMRPSEIGKYFGSELSDAELDEIYESYSHATMLQDTSFTFKNDGNIQGLRGDKYTGKPIDMLKNLHKLCRQYFNENKVHEVKIYDNRDLLPVKTRLVLHWHENKGTLINFLPIYSGEFDLKPVKK